MIKVFTILSICILGVYANAQKYISGQVLSESNKAIPNVEVINISNNFKTTTDNDGRFIIKATDQDELRIVKEGYERTNHRLEYQDFLNDFKVVLLPRPIEIEAVNVGLALTGNLKKDLKKVTNIRAENLNQEITAFLKFGKPTEVIPKATVPRDFQTPTMPNVGVDLIKTAGFISRLINGKSEKPTFFATEIQSKQFYKNLKNDLGEDYFLSFGFKDTAIDSFLMFCESKRHLASKYYKDYNVGIIKVELEELYIEYQNQKKGTSIDIINHKDLAKLDGHKFGFGAIKVAS